jgi:hypothetical protein
MKITDNQIRKICEYLEKKDRNSGALDFFKQYQLGYVDKGTIVCELWETFSNWYVDIESVELSPEEKWIFEALGI